MRPEALTDSERLLGFFGTREAWDDPGMRENALRLVRRYAAEGTAAGYDACARLLSTATKRSQDDALAALDLGLAERAVSPGGMGMAGLFGSVAIPERGIAPAARAFEPLTKPLADAISAAWLAAPADALRLRLAIRAGVADASSAVLSEAAAPSTAPTRRRVLLGILADLGPPGSVPVALAVLEGDHPIEVQSAALDVLARHGDDQRSSEATRSLPEGPAQYSRRRMRDVLLGRPATARAFLERVDNKAIAAAEVPVDQLRQVALHGDPKLDALVRKHWGSIQPGTAEEKLAEIRRLSNDLRAGPGDRARGKELFVQALCNLPQAVRRGG